MSFTNMPADNWRIATERVKWNAAYQKKHGIETGEAKLENEVAVKIKQLAALGFRALELSGYARFDFRMDEAGNPYVIEANPNPQLAKEEDFAQSAIRSRMNYSRLLGRIMALGLEWQPHRMEID
jgi:D-alanine-D-alanine ligase